MRFETLKEMISRIERDKFVCEAMSLRFGNILQSISYGEFQNAVRSMGTTLLRTGIIKGDKIGILSENRIEWPITYLGVTSIGAIIVPFDIFLSAEELSKAMNASDVSMIFVSACHIGRILQIKEEIPNVRRIVCLDEKETLGNQFSIAAHKTTKDTCGAESKSIEVPGLNQSSAFRQPEFLDYGSIIQMGQRLLQEGNDEYSRILVSPDDLAAMILTRNSTFAMLTHKGLLSNAYGSIGLYRCGGKYINQGEKWLATVPFHHTYPVLTGFLVPILSYGNVVIQSQFQVDALIRTIQEEEIDYIATVPIIVENLYKRLQDEEAVFKNLKFIISGGAPLHKHIVEGMAKLGISVLQGYGLTEYTPIVTANKPDANRPGSVGTPIINVQLRLDSEDGSGNGELLVKGPSLMKGYYKNPELTNTVIDREGWLHTGDIARIDQDGYVYITGRMKNVIVNKGGKNIYPEDIERVLLQSTFISQVVILPRIDPVLGEYAHAVIRPDSEVLAALGNDPNKSSSKGELRELIQAEIEQLNGTMAHHNRILDFELSNGQIPVESQKNTPFMFQDLHVKAPLRTRDNSQRTDQTTDEDSRTDEEQYLLDKMNKLFSRVVADYLGAQVETIELDQDLSDCGFDSISLFALVDRINKDYDIELNPLVFLERPTIQQIASYVSQTHRQELMRYYQQNT